MILTTNNATLANAKFMHTLEVFESKALGKSEVLKKANQTWKQKSAGEEAQDLSDLEFTEVINLMRLHQKSYVNHYLPELESMVNRLLKTAQGGDQKEYFTVIRLFRSLSSLKQELESHINEVETRIFKYAEASVKRPRFRKMYTVSSSNLKTYLSSYHEFPKRLVQDFSSAVQEVNALIEEEEFNGVAFSFLADIEVYIEVESTVLVPKLLKLEI